jgi:uncharacterized membrane protein YdjX (TVP38/TMEM64 family)
VDFAAGTAIGIVPKIALTAFAGASIARAMRGELGRDVLWLLLLLAAWIGIGWAARQWLRSRERPAE